MAYYDKFRGDTFRAQWWDYRENAPYFITICTKNQTHYFGECKNGVMTLSAIGAIVQGFWYEIPKHFPFAHLEEFQVMPNHIHGILVFDKTDQQLEQENVDMLHRNDLNQNAENPSNPFFSEISPKKGSLGVILRSYKSICSKIIHQAFPKSAFDWQIKFHDHIIRNQKSFDIISNYIVENPLRWKDDRYFGEKPL
jgi:putative transposase